ncbi:hypothetical protein BaRGS_00025802, partial [Batillaria attramentaria]
MARETRVGGEVLKIPDKCTVFLEKLHLTVKDAVVCGRLLKDVKAFNENVLRTLCDILQLFSKRHLRIQTILYVSLPKVGVSRLKPDEQKVSVSSRDPVAD